MLIFEARVATVLLIIFKNSSRIVTNESRVMVQIVASLTYVSRGIIYDPSVVIYTHLLCLLYGHHLWRLSYDDRNVLILEARVATVLLIILKDSSRIVINESRVMIQIVASLTDDSRGIIYDPRVVIYTHLLCLKCRHHLSRSSYDDHNMFIVEDSWGQCSHWSADIFCRPSH